MRRTGNNYSGTRTGWAIRRGPMTPRAAGERMKALTLTQPWAQAVALGIKSVETRSWRTHHRGLLAIHAARTFPAEARRFAEVERAVGRGERRIPFGAIVAVVEVLDCVPTVEAVLDIDPIEKLYGDYSPGRWAWRLRLVERVAPPVFVKGALGLWEWEVPQ